MEYMTVENCPFCGAMLPEKKQSEALLSNLEKLKQEGVLEHTLFVAVSIVKTMNDNNPAWLRETFEDQNKNLEKILYTNQEKIMKLFEGEVEKNSEIQTEIKEFTQDLMKPLTEQQKVLFEFLQNQSGSSADYQEKILKFLGKSLDSYNKKIEKQLGKISDRVSELKGSPQALGSLQEIELVKRLSSLKLGKDIYSSKKTRTKTDVKCCVKENGIDYGIVVIESKKTEKWKDNFVDQIRTYMEKENTEFGVIVSKTLPDDALNDTVWRDGVLIVTPEHLEPAYIFIRQHLIESQKLKMEYRNKLEKTEINDLIIQSVREATFNGELDKIINSVNKSASDVDGEITLIENYLKQRFGTIRKHTKSIQEFVIQLTSEHVYVIREKISELLKEAAVNGEPMSLELQEVSLL